MSKNSNIDASSHTKFSDKLKSRVIFAIKTFLQKKKTNPCINVLVYIGVGVAACIVVAVLLYPGLAVNSTDDSTTDASVTGPVDAVPYSVVLNSNASVEFQVGADNIVINVVGLNDEGNALIQGINFANLSIENAAIMVVDRLITENYITTSLETSEILLSASGQSVQSDALKIIMPLIRTASKIYDLSADIVKTGENEIKIVLTGSSNDAEPGTLPRADYDTLTTVLRLEYVLDSFAEIANVYLYSESEEALYQFVEFEGWEVKDVTLRVLSMLVEKGYITNGSPNAQVIMSIPGGDDDLLSEIKDMVSLVMQEAGLSFDVVQTDSGDISLVASDTPALERTAKYTLAEILNKKVNKTKSDITDLQMEILSRAFSKDKIESILKPRYWILSPGLIGLTEEQAVSLCEQVGLIPNVYTTDATEYSDVGKVVSQECDAKYVWEVGTAFGFTVTANFFEG